MTNPQKRRGDAAEREAAALISDHLGFPVRRALGAGRQDDIGDIHGLPQTSLQIANYASLDRAVREKLPDVDRQMKNMGASFGALFCRRRGGGFVVVQTPAQFFALWREATAESKAARFVAALAYIAEHAFADYGQNVVVGETDVDVFVKRVLAGLSASEAAAA